MLFTDSNFWISLFCEKEENHARAAGLNKEFEHENLLLSEHALGEIFTLILKRYGKLRAFEVSQAVLEEPTLEIVQAGENEWREALELGKKFGFSFCDCLTLAQMRSNLIKKIISFDSDFDRVAGVQRIC